jgi:hypothetical protein
MDDAVAHRRRLIEVLRSLQPWRGVADLSDEDWDGYLAAARLVQRSDPATVAAALDEFATEAGRLDEHYPGYEHESKPFLLMRVVFAIPETAPAHERFSYKGWSNWPDPDERGEVHLSWPVSWRQGRPRLVASYQGSEGQPYAVAAEYRFLRETFPYRILD